MPDLLPERTRRQRRRRKIPVLMLSAAELAEALGVSTRTVRTMEAAGRLPPAVKLGSLARFPLSRIRRWIQVNAPDAQTFAAIEAAKRQAKQRKW